MATQITVNSTHINVPVARFTQLDTSVGRVAKLLQPECHAHAKESFAKLSTLRQQLTAEKTALETAREKLVAAKAELKAERKLAALVVPTAINFGKLMGVPSIINFEPQDESWVENVETIAARFQAHGTAGAAISATLLARIDALKLADSSVKRASDDFARASQAFSATYRHLSNELVFGRAVLKVIGVAAPKGTPKKRKATTVKPVKADAANTVVPTAGLAPAA